MASELWKRMNQEAVRSLHGKPCVRSVEEKLRIVRTFKHWRKAGHEKKVILKRLKTSRETVRKWAGELGFDLEGTL
jgi:hypothetical protein